MNTIDKNNKYTVMQKSFYTGATSQMKILNHKNHNENPDLWNILFGDLNNSDWDNKVALEFGCGCGRNLENLFSIVDWKRVDGVDISKPNIEETEKFLLNLNIPKYKFDLYENNGIDLDCLKNDEYDFVFSTIVFQHIAVHEIRMSLKKEIYRVMKPGALFSFQMASVPYEGSYPYRSNNYNLTGTNGTADCSVENPDELVEDLASIGFKNISYIIRPSFSNPSCQNWVYVKAYK